MIDNTGIVIASWWGMMNAPFQNGTLARAFALAGNARLTLVSQKTGTRFTFRIAEKGTKENPVFFVALLNGPDNGGDFAYLGTIFPHKTPGAPHFYMHGKKSRVSREAPSTRAFAWAWAFLARGELPPDCEVWHEGRCGHCGRALTVPESLATGFGPVCAGAAA